MNTGTPKPLENEPTTTEVLEHAVELAELWGTCHGNYVNPDGAMCESGAVAAACGEHVHRKTDHGWDIVEVKTSRYWPRASYLASRALNNVGGGAWHNDHSTHEERIAKLKEAVEYAREQGW